MSRILVTTIAAAAMFAAGSIAVQAGGSQSAAQKNQQTAQTISPSKPRQVANARSGLTEFSSSSAKSQAKPGVSRPR
jgi:hypothetical protein